MSYSSRLQKAYEGALTLPLQFSSKYVIISDCHRGDGSLNDNFLKNQTLYLAALRHYDQNAFTYVELGDGDELWENRHMEQIIEIHNDVFRLLSLFNRQNRLYLLYGNHDIVKKKKNYPSKHYSNYPYSCSNNPSLTGHPLMPQVSFYEGILLTSSPSPCTSASTPSTNLFLTHGHQADLFNSTLWPLSRFLVRHIWKPLEHFGILDPTSAAKNYSRKKRTERRLQNFGRKNNLLLIAGHTHRPFLSPDESFYANSGSCVHPFSITCLEIEQLHISLVKWYLDSDSYNRLIVKRTILAGPYSLISNTVS